MQKGASFLSGLTEGFECACTTAMAHTAAAVARPPGGLAALVAWPYSHTAHLRSTAKMEAN